MNIGLESFGWSVYYIPKAVPTLPAISHDGTGMIVITDWFKDRDARGGGVGDVETCSTIVAVIGTAGSYEQVNRVVCIQ